MVEAVRAIILSLGLSQGRSLFHEPRPTVYFNGILAGLWAQTHPPSGCPSDAPVWKLRSLPQQ
ncbi:hypothetical protein [Leptolyngbya sp. CCY15150]|uniref:hypothetical protein n=1 Tax=Leptolyngbya sp. CCY15150 TaxID=2767772 RepID=UPI00194EEDBB|nr:hypothetical protein [Leptolyngbya sp. CCY15150]